MTIDEALAGKGYTPLQIEAYKAKKAREAAYYQAWKAAQPPKQITPPKPKLPAVLPKVVVPKVSPEQEMNIFFSPIPVTLATIKETVADSFKMTMLDIEGKSQQRDKTQARQTAIYLACRMTDKTLHTIAAHFGGRDHTTIIHARNATVMRMVENEAFRNRVEALAWNIKARSGL